MGSESSLNLVWRKSQKTGARQYFYYFFSGPLSIFSAAPLSSLLTFLRFSPHIFGGSEENFFQCPKKLVWQQHILAIPLLKLVW